MWCVSNIEIVEIVPINKSENNENTFHKWFQLNAVKLTKFKAKPVSSGKFSEYLPELSISTRSQI